MALSSYSELQSAIANWMNRDDLTDRIPEFIALFEARFNREVRWRKLLVRRVTEPDEEYEELPSDFVALKSIRFNSDPPTAPLTRVSEDIMEQLRYEAGGVAGTPRYYALTGDGGMQILFERPLADGLRLELLHYRTLPSLDDADNTTNSLLLSHPDVYLYGTLMEAEPYVKNRDELDLWSALYTAAVEKLRKQDADAEFGEVPLVMRYPRGSF